MKKTLIGITLAMFLSGICSAHSYPKDARVVKDTVVFYHSFRLIDLTNIVHVHDGIYRLMESSMVTLAKIDSNAQMAVARLSKSDLLTLYAEDTFVSHSGSRLINYGPENTNHFLTKTREYRKALVLQREPNGTKHIALLDIEPIDTYVLWQSPMVFLLLLIGLMFRFYAWRLVAHIPPSKRWDKKPAHEVIPSILYMLYFMIGFYCIARPLMFFEGVPSEMTWSRALAIALTISLIVKICIMYSDWETRIPIVSMIEYLMVLTAMMLIFRDWQIVAIAAGITLGTTVIIAKGISSQRPKKRPILLM